MENFIFNLLFMPYNGQDDVGSTLPYELSGKGKAVLFLWSEAKRRDLFPLLYSHHVHATKINPAKSHCEWSSGSGGVICLLVLQKLGQNIFQKIKMPSVQTIPISLPMFKRKHSNA